MCLWLIRRAGCWPLLVMLATCAVGQTRGKTGTPNVRERLEGTVSANWSNTPLARALESLATSQQMPIVLDRRVDPERELNMQLSPMPLVDALEQIARNLGIGYSQLGSVAYLGPTQTARPLRTVAAMRHDEASKLPASASRPLLQARAMKWDELAEPRQLVKQLATEAGVELAGAEKIPHDLWRASNWPAMSWIDRLTLIAAQFELTFRVSPSGKQVELVAWPESPSIKRSYPAGQRAESLVAERESVAPGAKLSREGNSLVVEGTLEDQEKIEARLRGTPTRRPAPTAGKEVYQLSLENTPVNRVLDQLAARLNLSITFDKPAIETAGIRVDQLVSVNVEKVDLDGLLKAILSGTGLSFRRQETAVTIYPDGSNRKQ